LQRKTPVKSESARELVEYIALALVEDTSSVRVTQAKNGAKIRLQLHVAKEDMGRVIGKGGKVANSIRQLLKVTSNRDGRQVTMDVMEPDTKY
jgi:predicted RNA-binding protein YlqC (UPF0109 family)